MIQTTPPTRDIPFDAVFEAPFGALGARALDDTLYELVFLPPGTPCRQPTTPLLEQLAAELAPYYRDPGHRFSLALHPRGTPYRQRVWQALQAIPAGQTRSYGELARSLATAPRALGQAVGDNPLPVLIPCHRVIAADGGLGGCNHSRTGFTQDIKRWLLQHEHAC